ncbi:tetratricopeptide repeat protein 39C [Lasioglossum baleicum]|uniref:tetratricopeptide repeat protein 39C n=1 Tax=Lasioglossum baleicum TaxID=434251 RepID=UPI003FCC8740
MAKKSEDVQEWRIAREGISLFLNNKTEEAKALFSKYPNSFHVRASRCFVSFMNALMTFEDGYLDAAIQLLKSMERECAMDIGWLKSMKSQVFRTEETGTDYVNRLESLIVLADSMFCRAILTLLQQEITGYVRGGWTLRKAWKVYQYAHSQIWQLYQHTFGRKPSAGVHTRCSTPSSIDSTYSLHSPYSQGSSELSISSCNDSANNLTPVSSPSSLRSTLSMLFSLTGFSYEQQTPFVAPAEVSRLMSAVNFGYGIYQLCVSLLPPSLVKVSHLLGFKGDREASLAALENARLSEDMRAPLATLSLLWYHTIVRPFFGLDGNNLRAGVNAVKQLIVECHPEFSESALFLFFTGRIERLESNVAGALDAYKKAVEVSNQREVKLLCLHEMAWCYLIRFNYDKAYPSLSRLCYESRWSKSLYAYLGAVCCGAIGNLDELDITYQKIRYFAKGRNRETQLGLFIQRRSPKLVDQETGQPYTVLYYRLLVYELLYLWNAMPSCTPDSLRKVLLECKGNRSDEPMVGLADLIEGAAHSYLGDKESSIESFRNCLRRRSPSNDLFDQHISAFALYELGSALCITNNVEEGRTVLLKALNDYTEYDFESLLSVRIRSTLRRFNDDSERETTLIINKVLKHSDYEDDPMSVRNTHCCANGGTCPAVILNSSRPSPWYCKLIKPFVFCVITSLLAMSVSHICDKYSASYTFKVIRSDLVNLRAHLNTLSMEVQNVMETRDGVKSKLKEVGYVIPKMAEAILYLRNEISEGMDMHMKALLKAMSPEMVKDLVRTELQTYDADKTGRTDYALQSSGGIILSTRNTETYSAGAPVLKLFGIPLCQQQNTPQTIIQTGVLPGECWAFKGSTGNVVIQLLGSVFVSGVSLEHIPESISPTGETSTAPKDFSLWGLDCVDDTHPFFFGEFMYDNAGQPIQYFEIQKEPKKPYEIVELKVHTNSGNNEYTCIYRIRVHGTLSQMNR